MISGLASFYHRNLGRALGSQLWLVTHSDTLIREAVGQKDFVVYHMQPPGQSEISNQVSPVQANEDLDRVVIDLIGDLAAYRPGAKLVIFEGGGDSEFDVRMTSTLFPDFRTAVNAISGGDKRRVNDLYEVLDRARQAGQLPVKVYAVTDSDGELSLGPRAPAQLQWDSYHIENYLLEPPFIRQVLRDINALHPDLDSDDAILAALRTCAQETIPSLIAHRLRSLANSTILECVNLGFDPSTTDAALTISEAISRSRQRINDVVDGTLRKDLIEQQAAQFNREVHAQLSTNEWKKTFRGREILRRFVASTVRDCATSRSEI